METQVEKSGERDLFFSGWCRKKLPNSFNGFRVYDVDLVLWDKENKWMALLEIKQHTGHDNDVRAASGTIYNKSHQHTMYELLSDFIPAGMKNASIYTGNTFKGYYVITFENRTFDDGKCWIGVKNKHKIDYKVVDELTLIRILSGEFEIINTL